MKTLVATIIVTAALLSAGAFANNAATQAPGKLSNVTVIVKNQAWPLKSRMTVEPCRVSRCLET